MLAKRFMVCTDCLKRFYHGEEKSCSHGWDIVAGKPRGGICHECGKEVDALHCPGGLRTPLALSPDGASAETVAELDALADALLKGPGC
jgi:hypothetical protein